MYTKDRIRNKLLTLVEKDNSDIKTGIFSQCFCIVALKLLVK